VARIMPALNDFLAVPVVDREERLVGDRPTVDDVIDVIQQGRATRVPLRPRCRGKPRRGRLLPRATCSRVARRRVVWLLVLAVANKRQPDRR